MASTQSLRAAYLVGCDGGASPVRKELGIGLAGEGNMLALRQALYRCDELFDRLPIGNGPGKGRHYHVADDKATQLIMQDSTRHWTLHSIVDTDEEMNASSRRPSACRSTTRCCPAIRGGRTCCSPIATARAACSSPATPCIWSFRPADSA